MRVLLLAPFVVLVCACLWAVGVAGRFTRNPHRGRGVRPGRRTYLDALERVVRQPQISPGREGRVQHKGKVTDHASRLGGPISGTGRGNRRSRHA